jgi:DNA polymerase-3 subunit beta
MKFSIDKHVLLEPLKRVASALPSKSLIPILSGILFVNEEDGLSITAGDSFIFIRETIPTENYQSIKHGRAVLPGSNILKIAEKSGDVIDVEVKGSEVTAKSGSSKFKLSSLDVEDYPDIPEVDADPIFIKAEELKKSVKKVAFAAVEPNEKQVASELMGVNFKFEDGHLELTATNRHRASRTKFDVQSNIEISTIIHKENLLTMLKSLPNGEIEFQFGYSAVIAKTKGLLFYTRVLEGTFPDVTKAVPESFQSSATINIQEFIAALENMTVVQLGVKKPIVKLHFTNQFYLESKTETGLADAEVKVTDPEGDELTLTFNIAFFLDSLKSLECEQARIYFNGPLKPMKICGVEETSSIHIVLPYRSA